MIARSPREAVRLADEAFNRGDLEGMLAFYEDGAVMLFAPGQMVSGKPALRDALRPLLGMNPTASHERVHVIVKDDIALWTSDWSVSGSANDGAPTSQRGRNATVFRRGPDGGWRVVIENPWGAAVLDWADTDAGSTGTDR